MIKIVNAWYVLIVLNGIIRAQNANFVTTHVIIPVIKNLQNEMFIMLINVFIVEREHYTILNHGGYVSIYNYYKLIFFIII